MRLGGLIFTVYLVIGILVGAGVIGNEANYFSGMDSIEEVVEMLLAVFLWPLVLLDVNMNIGGAEGGGGGDPTEGGGEAKGGDTGGGGDGKGGDTGGGGGK